jgi:hypothetical protein
VSGFCAICTSERGPFVRRPLGRGDALVSVCADCDDEPARTKVGPAIDYYVPDRVIIGRTVDAFAAAANRVTGDTKETNIDRTRSRSLAGSAQPGFIVVRVRRHRVGADPIDAQQARMTFQGEPWFSELRNLGSTRRWHLFERPDIDAASAARLGTDRDPLADIEKYRSEP